MTTALQVLAAEADRERSKMTTEQLLHGLINAHRKMAIVQSLGAPKSVLEVSSHNVEGYKKALANKLAVLVHHSSLREEDSQKAWDAQLPALAVQAAAAA